MGLPVLIGHRVLKPLYNAEITEKLQAIHAPRLMKTQCSQVAVIQYTF